MHPYTASCHSKRLKKWPLGHSTDQCNTKRCSRRVKKRSRLREVTAQYFRMSASLNIEAAVRECYQCFTPQRFKLSGELTNRRSQCEEMSCVPQTILIIFLTASESSESCAVSDFPWCPQKKKKPITGRLSILAATEAFLFCWPWARRVYGRNGKACKYYMKNNQVCLHVSSVLGEGR